MSNPPSTGNSYTFNSPDLSFSHQSSFTIPPGADAATIRDLQIADLAKTEKFFGEMGDKLRALQQERPLTEGEQAGLGQADAWRNQARSEQQALRDEAALASCEQPSRHIANATAWRAICTDPDWCKVGNSVVAFDSFAIIDQVQIASPNVKAQCVPVYRIGDLHKGIQADAGAQLIAQTSLGSGYTKMLSGSNKVKVNNLPVARDGSECLVNCNIMGVGGAKGKIVTETKGGGGSSPPSTASNPQAPPGERTSPRLEELKRQEAELKKRLINVDAADEYVRFDDLNKMIDQYVQAVPEMGLDGEFKAQVSRGVLKTLTGLGEGVYELGKLGVEGMQRRYLPGGTELSIVQGQILAENVALGNVTGGSVASAVGRGVLAIFVPPGAQQSWGKGNYVEAVTHTAGNLITSFGTLLKGGTVLRGAKGASSAVDDVARASVGAADEVARVGPQIVESVGANGKKVFSTIAHDGVHISAGSKRALLLSYTPDKYTRVGREVLERMRKEGKVKEIDGVTHIKSRADDAWYPLDDKIHMAHDIHPDYWPTVDGVKVPTPDAVTWWNEVGSATGARSEAVRTMMMDSRNYYFERGSYNSSAGSLLRQTYVAPQVPPRP